MRLLLALLLTLAALAASAPCDPGWTYFPDLDLLEYNAAPTPPVGGKKFSGSCLRLYSKSVPVLTGSRSFAVVARDTCSYITSGGRLLSFNTLGTSTNAIMPVITSLISGASTNLVLTGGFQNPNAKGAASLRSKNWIWSDAYTSPSIINNGANWGTSQPDDTGNFAATAGVNGTASGVENAVANFLAMQVGTGLFFDVTGTERMDFVCQYRAAAPCPSGYRYFAPISNSVDSTNEYGMASCIKVVPTPATLQDARDVCAGASSAPQNSATKYYHVATYHNVTTQATDLTSLVKRLASRAGVNVGTTPLWTGAIVRGTPQNNVVSWVDERVFDSTVTIVDQPNTITGADGYEIVLNLAGSVPVLQTYRDVNGATMLPYVCEADVAVRIDNAAVGSVLFGYGKVISYAVPQLSSGYMACASNFNALSGNVACKQAGYDRGFARASSQREEVGGTAPRVIVGTGCGGSEAFLEDCADSLSSGSAVPFSESACEDPHLTLTDCSMENMQPGQFPSTSSAGDLNTDNGSSGDLSGSDMAITIVVVVVGAFLIVLAAVYIVKGVRSLKRTSGHSVLPSPPPKAAAGESAAATSPVSIRVAEKTAAV